MKEHEAAITCQVVLTLDSESRIWLKDVFARLLASELADQLGEKDRNRSGREAAASTALKQVFPAPVPADRLLVTKREASRLLSISARNLEYRISQKQFQVRRVGRRVLIPMKEVRRFALQNHF